MRRTSPPNCRPPSQIWSDVVTDRSYACPAVTTYRALAARGPLDA